MDNGTIIAGRTGRPQLTVGAKDGLSNPQLNLANTARGGRGGGGGCNYNLWRNGYFEPAGYKGVTVP